MSREHVFGEWLSHLGLASEPVGYRAGPLNRIPKDLGTGPMFSRTVRNVCAECNNGWMSRLEQEAGRVLTPLVMGEPTDLDSAQLGVVAAWAHKTALVALLVSSQAERAEGYGLEAAEYTTLYNIRDLLEPPAASRYWIGRYDGQMQQASAGATPFTIEVDGMPAQERPNGYTTTVAVGRLLIHGARFTTPWMNVDLENRRGLPQIWPVDVSVRWPTGNPIGDDDFLALVQGRDIRSPDPSLRVVPWKNSVGLPDSELLGAVVAVPSVCGQHTIHYPRALMKAARRGDVIVFIVSCECDLTYLIELGTESARFKRAGPAAEIRSMYEALPGREGVVDDDSTRFRWKLVDGPISWGNPIG